MPWEAFFCSVAGPVNHVVLIVVHDLQRVNTGPAIKPPHSNDWSKHPGGSVETH